MIRKFINLDDIELKQKKAVMIIQTQFRRFKKYQTIRKKIHEAFLIKGFTGKLEELPDELLIYSFNYLDLKDLLRIVIVNKRWNQIVEQPILWTTLNLFHSKIKIEISRFQTICRKAWQLQYIDLRYCQFINADSLQSISQNCNPDS